MRSKRRLSVAGPAADSASGSRAGGNPASREVTTYLERLEPEARRVVGALRAGVLRAVPDAEETIAWGSLSYHTPWIGGRVKGALCQIAVRRGAVQLEFIHGVRLTDPAGLLQGTRKSKRFVPIRSVAEARRPAIVALVRAASEVEFPTPQSTRRSPARDQTAAEREAGGEWGASRTIAGCGAETYDATAADLLGERDSCRETAD